MFRLRFAITAPALFPQETAMLPVPPTYDNAFGLQATLAVDPGFRTVSQSIDESARRVIGRRGGKAPATHALSSQDWPSAVRGGPPLTRPLPLAFRPAIATASDTIQATRRGSRMQLQKQFQLRSLASGQPGTAHDM